MRTRNADRLMAALVGLAILSLLALLLLL